ncbi:MAG TPA: hypothetical protein VGZ49_15360, partial [Xanthobacteraceae bacterium]|nr:hypothetical protein [Xanthobacteraceae bacterium]
PAAASLRNLRRDVALELAGFAMPSSLIWLRFFLASAARAMRRRVAARASRLQSPRFVWTIAKPRLRLPELWASRRASCVGEGK